MSVTVCTPAIPHPARLPYLLDAMASVRAQTIQPVAHVVVFDYRGDETATRNTALAAVQTPWTAWLDDDDWLLPHHLERCLAHAEATGADLVYPHFESVGGGTPEFLARTEGQPFDADLLQQGNFIPSTVLVRTELAQRVGGYPAPGWHGDRPMPGDNPRCIDWGFLIRLLDAGATFAHLPERTWVWRRTHEANTAGAGWLDLLEA